MSTSLSSSEKVEIVGRYAGILSLIEIGLGSLLHAFRIPLAGNFLSLNQGYLLCRATIHANRAGATEQVAHVVSNAAAVLKSLAPAGKKLGPMLSLSAQGFLFSVGPRLFGANLLGLSLGMVLLSTWTFLQPLITYYLFFGDQLFSAFDYFQQNIHWVRTSTTIVVALFAALVLAKMLIAVYLAWLAWRSSGAAAFQGALLERARMQNRVSRPSTRSPLVAALRDICTPLFLLSFALTVTFLIFVESAWSRVIWLSMRPVALAFLFFYFSRKINLRSFLKRHRSELAQVTERALQEIDRERPNKKP